MFLDFKRAQVRFINTQVFMLSFAFLISVSGCDWDEPDERMPVHDGNLESPNPSPGPSTPVAAPDVVPAQGTPDSHGGRPSTIPSSVAPDVPPTFGCHSDDSSQFCIGLKYVVYKDPDGIQVVSENVARTNLAHINKIWAPCEIQFQIDNYVAVDPVQFELNFSPSNDEELHRIREVFDDSRHLLLVTTGSWNRRGTLGNTSANAWSNMPGFGIYGAILEAPVGDYPNILAHEIGHYLNLGHESDSANLMNPIIYESSLGLLNWQCNTAKNTAVTSWLELLR